ncbi:MAG: ArnT family glycosyltransferase [Gemmataceae bacterium]
MDETSALPGPGRREWPWLLLLLAVACGLRAWHLTHTEVTTRDSIGFIRYAWQLGHRPLADALRGNPYHPLYPAAVLAASKVVVPLSADGLPRAMQRSAQAVNAAVSVLLVLVLYLLGRELFDARVGFWGAMLFQLMPSSGRLLGDGLSEPLFFLWVGLALFAAARGLRADCWRWMAAVGAFSGLAYLTRPEGLLIAAVAALVVLFHRRSLSRAAVIAVPLVLVAAPYAVTIGRLTAKPSAEYFFDPNKWNEEKAAAVAAPLPLAKWEVDWGKGNDPSKRWGWAAWALVAAIDRAFLHGLELFAAFALWRHRARVWRDPAFAVQAALGLLMLALCYRVAQSNGYLGERHVMLIFLPGVFWMVAGIGLAARRLGRPTLAASALLAAVAGVGLARTAQPLHAERAGFREAGEWIAANTLPGDKVLDPYAHAYYHSGRVFTDGRTDLPRTAPETCYVVLERSGNDHPHLYHLVKEAKFLADRGEEVARIPMPRKKEAASVGVYRVRWRLERNVGG